MDQMGQRDLQGRKLAAAASHEDIRTATLAMGCFWGPEALFGHMPGVVRTRVGYAGGTSEHPSYRQMGDHTETLQIDYEPAILPFEEILDTFWNNHNPMNINDYKGRQYMSLLFYNDENERQTIRQVLEKRKGQGKGEPDTWIAPYSGFHLAEDRHQKYYLKRYPDAMEKLGTLYPSGTDLANSTLAARLNGLAKGYTNLERIISEIREWPDYPDDRELMIKLIKHIRW